MSLVDQCDSVVYGNVPYFVSELTFRDSIQVRADNGFEKFPLMVIYDRANCKGFFRQASVDGDMHFYVNENSELILDDTKWTRKNKPSVFIKVDNSYAGFRQEMNRCLFRRPYVRIENDKPVRGSILLLPNGQMDGMPPYNGYTVCLAGDCMEEADPFHPIITFSSQQGENVSFAFKKNGKDIEFYNLSPSTPDQKGGRKVKDLAFRWREQ